MTSYESHQVAWETQASVRTKSRVILQSPGHDLFPIVKQPICAHPLIQELGSAAIQYILVQTAYKFMANIALIETLVVNHITTKIANNDFHILFPEKMQLDSLTIIVDESYHAYVARDYIMQLKNLTQIDPIEARTRTGLSTAIAQVDNSLSALAKEALELIAVCIAENSITQYLGQLMRSPDINNEFSQVTSDHLKDEGRHAIFFGKVLEFYWEAISECVKAEVAPVVPIFIENYLKFEDQKEYDRKILQALGLSERSVEKILHDTYVEYHKNLFLINPVARNVIKFIEKCGLLGHLTMRRAFDEYSSAQSNEPVNLNK